MEWHSEFDLLRVYLQDIQIVSQGVYLGDIHGVYIQDIQ